MAVVIILIIIIFIAINKVNKTTKDSRDKAILANAGVYIKAVNSYLSLEGVNNDGLESTSLTLSLIKKSINVSGTKPNSGTFEVENYEVIKACLEYSGFKVDYNNGNFSDVKKGTCEENNSFEFAYTGSVQEFIVPVDGVYNIELWGAGGGLANSTFAANYDHAGYGAYTSGDIYLKSGETLYIYVGQKGNQGVNGSSSRSAATYNGGGAGAGASDNDDSSGSGGGATDVRLVAGEWNSQSSLVSRIMVAAGGAGAPLIGKGNSFHGGHGGGLTGAGNLYRWENALVSDTDLHATQTSGYSLGIGQDAILGIGCAGSGAGGGYWGGRTQQYTSSCGSHGGGGSSYISGHTGCVAITSADTPTPKAGCANGTTDQSCSVHYSNKVFTNTVMIPGNEKIPSHNGESASIGNRDDGFARISYIGEVSERYVYAYTGSSQTFTVPKTGKYQLEVWGAQGGSYNDIYHGGYGGYSTGVISLNKDEVLYIQVGGAGVHIGSNNTTPGGYNGGGAVDVSWSDGNERRSAGGGATHIAKKDGVLSSFDTNNNGTAEQNEISDLIIVAGGGGGAQVNAAIISTANSVGGAGGGYKGSAGTGSEHQPGQGGTQTAGGAGYSSYSGTFGKGGNTQSGNESGGGGGFYGGGASIRGAAGGSGYIGYGSLTKKSMYCYDCENSTADDTKTISTDCINDLATAKCAKQGNGYARITFIE